MYANENKVSHIARARRSRAKGRNRCSRDLLELAIDSVLNGLEHGVYK
jgi:hypothetical protein